MSAKSRPAEVPAAANASETAFWETTPGEGRNLATVSGQKCVRGRAKERARCPIGVQRPPSAPHDVRLGGTPRPVASGGCGRGDAAVRQAERLKTAVARRRA